MPNKIKRYKRGVVTTGRLHAGSSRKGASVKALLERLPGLALGRISQQASVQARWREWLGKHLPAALLEHVSGVADQDGKLVVFTESAAWSARARYALAELEPLIKKEWPALRQVVVKVMPRR